MAMRLVLLTRKGTPFPKGLPVELLRGTEVMEKTTIGEDGVVVFRADNAGGCAVRMRLGETLKAIGAHPSGP